MNFNRNCDEEGWHWCELCEAKVLKCKHCERTWEDSQDNRMGYEDYDRGLEKK